jgi:hypothetical protein
MKDLTPSEIDALDYLIGREMNRLQDMIRREQMITASKIEQGKMVAISEKLQRMKKEQSSFPTLCLLKNGDQVQVIKRHSEFDIDTRGKTAIIREPVRGNRYCVDFGNGWQGYYLREELELVS